MPTARGAASAAAVGGKLYVTGGANSLTGVTENGIHPARPHNVMGTVEEYDPATNTWRERQDLRLRRLPASRVRPRGLEPGQQCLGVRPGD